MLRKLQRALGSPLTLQGGMGLLLVSCSVVFDSLRHPRPVAHQAPLSIGFSRQEYQSGLPLPPPGDLPDPGIEPMYAALQLTSLPLNHKGSRVSWV